MTLTLGLEGHIIDQRHGVWCDTCSLPSAVEIDCAICDPRDLHVINRFTILACRECGESERRKFTL